MLCVFQAGKWWAVRSSECAPLIGMVTASPSPFPASPFPWKTEFVGYVVCTDPVVCRGAWTAGIFTVSRTSSAVIMIYALHLQGFCSQVLKWSLCEVEQESAIYLINLSGCEAFVSIDGRMYSVMGLVTLELSSAQWLGWQGKRMREFKLVNTGHISCNPVLLS